MHQYWHEWSSSVSRSGCSWMLPSLQDCPPFPLSFHSPSVPLSNSIMITCTWALKKGKTFGWFTCMPAKSYQRQLRSLLLCLCDVFQALINSFARWFFPLLFRRKVCLEIPEAQRQQPWLYGGLGWRWHFCCRILALLYLLLLAGLEINIRKWVWSRLLHVAVFNKKVACDRNCSWILLS